MCFFGMAILLCLGYYSIKGKTDNEFEIVNCYKIGSDSFQDVTLHVLVNKKNYNEEEMLLKVRDFYYQNNGQPDSLEINLYDSESDFEKSEYRAYKGF